MADYSKQINNARKAIKEKGSPITFVSNVSRVDPVTGKRPIDSVPVQNTVNAVFVSVDRNLVPDSRITSTSRMMLIDADYRPTTKDTVNINNAPFSVNNIYEVGPDITQPIMYKVLING